MLLDELAAKIGSDGHTSTSSTSAWFLVTGGLVDDVLGSTWLGDKVVALIETQGGPPSPRPRFQDAAFQLLVRGSAITEVSTAYSEAREKIEAIHLDLDAFGSASLSGVHYVGIWAEQNPFFGGYDHRGRPTFACNYRAFRSSTE